MSLRGLSRGRRHPAPCPRAGLELPLSQVHHGFLSAYTSVRPQVLGVLDALLAGEAEPWTVYCTGHSLGGALSTLCAYDLARRTK